MRDPRKYQNFSRAWAALCLLAAFALGGEARAALLVDTGPGGTSSVGSISLFASPAHFQHLAGRFTLSSPASLDSVEGWMGPFGTGGSIAVKIRADGSVPGTAIYSKTYTLGTRIAAGWDTFSNFDTTLPAGTYWLSFEPVAGGGMNYSMPPGAASPLPGYAYLADGNPGWLALLPNPGLGMRVSGGPVFSAPLGTAIRAILDTPLDNLDILRGGDDDVETYSGAIDLNGYGWALARGAIYANWLECGALAVNSQALNASRAVAWRSFRNASGSSLTLRVNATLDGSFDDGFGSSTMKAWSGIHALDAAMFSDTVAASGMSTEEFLLGGNALDGIDGAANRISLATLFPVAARLGSDTEEVFYSPSLVTIPMQTGLFSVDPDEVFTLLFDVTALASGSGTGGTLFLNTLEPGPVLFTDSGGNPVVGIEVLGDSIVVGEANFLSWLDRESLEWQPALGATDYRVYRGNHSDLPNLLDGAADACLDLTVNGTSTPPVLDEDPPSGTLYWYLIVGVEGATEGSSGDASGVPRQLSSIGPCF